MLRKREIIFKESENKRLHVNNGSILHGFLIERVNNKAADMLHSNSMRPFSQYLHFSKDMNRWIWTVNTLNEDMDHVMEDALGDLNCIELKHKGSKFMVDHQRVHPSKTYKELTEECYGEEINRNVSVSFLTPCSFKISGRNVIYPEIPFIYNNIINKWNSVSDLVSIDDKLALEHIINHTHIRDFNIRGSNFSLESVRIKGFTGRIHFSIKGPESLVSLTNLMFSFAEYSGLGSRTALGMGGISVEFK